MPLLGKPAKFVNRWVIEFLLSKLLILKILAEAVRFELTVESPLRQFSRLLP